MGRAGRIGMVLIACFCAFSALVARPVGQEGSKMRLG